MSRGGHKTWDYKKVTEKGERQTPSLWPCLTISWLFSINAHFFLIQPYLSFDVLSRVNDQISIHWFVEGAADSCLDLVFMSNLVNSHREKKKITLTLNSQVISVERWCWSDEINLCAGDLFHSQTWTFIYRHLDFST